MNHFIRVKDLKKSYHQNPVLTEITFDVTAGEMIVFIGPSGCGKSTLLRCLNGLEIMDSGSIDINGINLRAKNEKLFQKKAAELRGSVGMVFQSFNLFPHLTLLENIMMAPQVVKKIPRQEAEAIARKLLAKVGLTDHANHYPAQLSGGQQQRGAIARALAMAPKVMLYDEPTSALDPELVDEVLQVMKQLDAEGMTQIIVTHEMRFARAAADRIVHMDKGSIVDVAAAESMFSNPRDDRTKRFLKNFL